MCDPKCCNESIPELAPGSKEYPSVMKGVGTFPTMTSLPSLANHVEFEVAEPLESLARRGFNFQLM